MSTTFATTPAGTKLRALADRMTAEIQERRRPMTQNATQKRLREYYSRLFDADQLESGQKGLYAMADAHDAGTLPLELVAVKTKAEVLDLMRLASERNRDDRIFATARYCNTTPLGVALQELVKSMGKPEDVAAANERDRQRELQTAMDRVRFADMPGFFPTPPRLAAQLIDLAMIGPGHLVLEPSAGLGDLADAVKNAEPTATVHCIEIRPSLQEILRLKGHTIIGDDFMSNDWFLLSQLPNVRLGAYDRIVMNAPFERGQDGEHTQRAFAALKPGGRMASIVSTMSYRRSDSKAQAFKTFLDRHAADILPVEPGAFSGAAAFRNTGVACEIVLLHKQS